MRLLITTPTAVIADVADATSVRAEDGSGAFGVLDGHADLLTVLDISILTWREANGSEHYCAVRRGVLRVIGGTSVEVATREAVVDEDIDRLEHAILARFRQSQEEERTARSESVKLQTTAIRRIMSHLRPEGTTTGIGEGQ